MSFNIGGFFQSLIQALPFVPKAPPAPEPVETPNPVIKMASDSLTISRAASSLMAANRDAMPLNGDPAQLDLSPVRDQSGEILSNNGANLISNNGGTIISNNGANAIGGNFPR